MRSNPCKPHFAAAQNRIVRKNPSATSADCASVPTTSVEEIQTRSLQTPFRVASLGYLAAVLSTLSNIELRVTVPPGEGTSRIWSARAKPWFNVRENMFSSTAKLWNQRSGLVNNNLTEISPYFHLDVLK